jgi:YcxB-like protein
MEAQLPVAGTFDQSVAIGLRGVRALHAKELRRDRFIGGAFLAISLFVAFVYSMWLALFIAVGGVLLWLGALDPLLLQVRMLYRSNPELRHRVDITVDDSSVTFRSPETTMQMKWSRYQRLIEAPDVFVLVFGKNMIHMIPNEAFANDAGREAFRRLARAQLPDRGGTN